MYVQSTDVSNLSFTDPNEIKQAIKDIKAAKINITDEGDIQDFLGVNIDRKSDVIIHLTQPYPIDQILDDLKMGEKMKLKDTPDSS